MKMSKGTSSGGQQSAKGKQGGKGEGERLLPYSIAASHKQIDKLVERRQSRLDVIQGSGLPRLSVSWDLIFKQGVERWSNMAKF